MSMRFRNYTNDLRFTDDFFRVWKFLQRINSEKITTPNFLWARWEWMFSLPYLDAASLAKIGIWEDDGRIVALATYETNVGEAYICVDDGYEYLKSEILSYAKLNLSKNDAFRALIPDDDKVLQAAVLEQGFRPTQSKERVSVIDITDHLKYTLPDGFSISSMADEYDLQKIERCCWRGFNHEGEPPNTDQTRQEQIISGSGPN